MSFPDLLISLMSDFLLSTNTYLAAYVNMPVNATGPLDPNITLTALGGDFIDNLAKAAIAWSGTFAKVASILIP